MQSDTISSELTGMNKAIKEAVENNIQDSPQLSIDPDNGKMAILGDANQIQPTSGDYELTFSYPADQLSEEDKAKMKPNVYGDYNVKMTYKGHRVKPLYRTKVALLVARVMDDTGIFSDDDSIKTEKMTNKTAQVLVDHVEDLAEIAQMVLGVPRDQMEYMTPDSLAEFFNQLLANEPNIIPESLVFLEQYSRPTKDSKAGKKPVMPKKPSKQSTPQN